MQAVFVNCIAVIAGSIIGVIFAKKITDELSKIISSAAGIVTLFIGIKMAFSSINIVFLALSLIIGGILGSWWDIDVKILTFGRFLERIFLRPKKNRTVFVVQSSSDLQSARMPSQNFAYGFLNASVLFCVGAMSIVGSFQAGVNGDFTTIYTKSILDGFLAIVLASTLGIGVAFSALTVLIYQGSLTLLSIWVEPYITETLLSEITAIGGALIMMIGINLLDIKKLKTANYLPSVVLMVLFCIGEKLIMVYL